MLSFIITVSIVIFVPTILCANFSAIDAKVDNPIEIVNKTQEQSQLLNEKICKLPVVRGHCRALLPRWRYDSQTKKCHEFKFGGCDGNGNNFLSEKECMKKCEGV